MCNCEMLFKKAFLLKPFLTRLTLVTFDVDVFMIYFDMSMQTFYVGKIFVTKPTIVFDIFMNCCSMCFKMSFFIEGFFTIITCK